MTGLEIALIVIGCVLVVISFFVTEKISDNINNYDGSSIQPLWGEKEETTIKDRVKDIVSDKSEELIDTVEDRLCHISNEKIIEFKEYSDQVLEKINEEHKQLVFLYNMLNKKQEEMKVLCNELDIRYVKLSDGINKVIDNNEESKDSVSDTTGKQKQNKTPNTKNSGVKKDDTHVDVLRNNSSSKEQTDKIITPENDDTKSSVVKKNVSSVKSSTNNESKKQSSSKSKTDKSKAGPDRNERILSLWEQGKTVLEISKQLGIGQGEAKLVIDLFKE